MATRRLKPIPRTSYERAESVDHDGLGSELALIPKLNMAPASVGIDTGRAWTDPPLESA